MSYAFFKKKDILDLFLLAMTIFVIFLIYLSTCMPGFLLVQKRVSDP